MARKRPEFSFPELEHRGRNAILRSSAEVAAEEALLAEGTPAVEPVSPSVTPPDVATPASPSAPDTGSTRRPFRRAAAEAASEPAPAGSGYASVRARTRASKSTPASQVVDRVRQKLQAKQHLSSYTFRFRAEELEQLDRLVTELNRDRAVKLSKNDLIRVALGWLLTDYDEYGSESLVVEVTRQE
jgi:hypothetical protein